MPNYNGAYTGAQIDEGIGIALNLPPQTEGQVRNRWVANQNFNVIGKNGYPLLDAVPQDILAGNEIAAGIIALTDCLQMTKINGVINSASNTGIIRRSYPKDDAGEVTKESQYGGFKNHVGEQIQAVIGSPGTGGAEISDDASDVHVDISLNIATDGLQFLFLADEQGIIENVSDENSAWYANNPDGVIIDVNGGANIAANQRYEIDIATAIGADWVGKVSSVTAVIFNNSGSGTADYGPSGSVRTGSIGRFAIASLVGSNIVVQTGITSLSDASIISGNGFGNAGVISSTDCKVLVTRVK